MNMGKSDNAIEADAMSFTFTVSNMTTGATVSATTQAFEDNFDANSYGFRLRDSLRLLGLYVEWHRA